MDKIRVCYLDPQVKDVASMMSSLHIKDKDLAEKMIWDDENPEYI